MSETKRLRRPAEGGYARGDETRQRIIIAAIELFGEHGFAAASTRDIAARAGVNAPALQYYFENKEGVYRACAVHIAEDVWSTFEPVVTRAQQALDAHADARTLMDAFVAIQETMANRMFEKAVSACQRLFFVREQAGQEPAIASEILQERLRQPLHRVSAALIGRISGTAPDDPVTLIRMLSLFGQLMVFNMAPRSSMTLLGWQEVDAQKVEQLKSIVRDQTLKLFEAWHAEGLTKQPAGKRERVKQTKEAEESGKPAHAKPTAKAAASKRTAPAARAKRSTRAAPATSRSR